MSHNHFQPEKLTTVDDVFNWMDQACRAAIQPSLKRMWWMLPRLEHPEKRGQFIHIAGTNGKGSTAAMVATVLTHAGHDTGLFISPHVVHWSERIQYNTEYIQEASFVRWANHLRPVAEEMRESEGEQLSPFEFYTLLALCYFAYEACPRYVVWETGMGGRWDATNVVNPLVSVITQIGLDHTHWLGDTRTMIAKEKAGIIKNGVPVVCGPLDPEEKAVIQMEARQKRSPLYLLDKDFGMSKIPDEKGKGVFLSLGTKQKVPLPLSGEHQRRNTAVALMTLKVLRDCYAARVDEGQIQQGLHHVIWPGRLEVVDRNPLLLLDGAHNADGVKALTAALKEYDYNRLRVLIAITGDRSVSAFEPLLCKAHEVITTQLRERFLSYDAKELAKEISKMPLQSTVHVTLTSAEGLTYLRSEAAPRDLLLVTGSLYLVSEVRALLKIRKNDLADD